ncbi:MAG: hypothetical protein R3F61_15345 [Myxococcota bacterium]
MNVLFALLAGCSGDPTPPAPEPTEEPAPEEPAPAPADVREGLHVEPMSIRWDAGAHNLSVEARLVGKGVAERKEPVHIGVTVITESDTEVDLLVHTLFPAAMGESVLFATELEENPKHVLVGAWNTRVEPCDSERPGCREFGFVLDGSIASFPALLYTEGMRQRFLPAGFDVQVKGDPKKVAAVADRYAAVFGSTVKTAPYEGDLAPGVYVGRADDLGIAHAVGTALDVPYSAKEGLPASMVVVPR